MKGKILLFMLCIPFAVLLGKNKLVSGPMQGHTTPTSMKVWLMVKKADVVEMTLINEATGEKHQQKAVFQKAVSYKKYSPVVLTFDQLTPNTSYKYELKIGDKLITGDRILKTSPTDVSQPFSFLIGSCAITVPNFFKPFHPGNEERIYPAMVRTPSDFMLWLGDYLYYVFFQYRTPENMLQKNVNKRKKKKINAFLASRPQYAIWDDHDYGPNDGDKDFALKKESLELWKLFWANPYYGTPESEGCFFNFKYLDAEFFMTDDRYYRTEPDDTNSTMLGKGQFEWLLKKLEASTATFKFIVVGSQVTNQMNEGECWLHYMEEIQAFFDFIREKSIKGVIFLSGDRHFTELLKMGRTNSYPLYEFTSSPITSIGRRPKKMAELSNPNIVPGTLYLFQNYGRITISGESGDRSCVLETFDKKGNKAWSYTIHQSELQ